jgi:hypothetical protein
MDPTKFFSKLLIKKIVIYRFFKLFFLIIIIKINTTLE